MMAIQDFQPASQSASLWPASLRPASLLPAPVPEPASHWPASLLSAPAPESASHRSASCMSSPISESPFWGTLLAFKRIPTSKQSSKRRWGYPSSGYPLPSATDPLLPSAKELPTVQSGLQSADSCLWFSVDHLPEGPGSIRLAIHQSSPVSLKTVSVCFVFCGKCHWWNPSYNCYIIINKILPAMMNLVEAP